MSLLSRRDPLARAPRRLLDAALIALTLAAVLAWLGLDWNAHLVAAAPAGAAAFLAALETRPRYVSPADSLGSVIASWAIACALLVAAAFVLDLSAGFSRAAVLMWFLAVPAPLVASRLVRLPLRPKRVAIAGCTRLADGIVRRLEEASAADVRVVGVFDDRARERISGERENLFRHAGSFEALLALARRGEVETVFIALPLRAELRIAQLVERLADTTASVYVVPDFLVFDLMRRRLTLLGELPAVSVYESPFDGVNGVLKRAEDLLLGSAALALAALPMALIALAVKLTSGGPVLFRQRRYGLTGRIVHVLKFRSMTSADDGPRVAQASRDDRRVTPLGRFLRATSLDELPQLFNVLSGEMSLVGPRPHAVAHNEEYRGLIRGYMLRHKVKPGITGWAQVNGWRGETDSVDKMRRRVEYDLAYVGAWSLGLDLRILAATVATVLSRKNAY
jgi:putative colanic acid biosynthesis UDP-glucose lipid carrier transferase